MIEKMGEFGTSEMIEKMGESWLRSYYDESVGGLIENPLTESGRASFLDGLKNMANNGIGLESMAAAWALKNIEAREALRATAEVPR